MTRRRAYFCLVVALAAGSLEFLVSRSLASDSFIQANISAAEIHVSPNRYVIEVRIVATDVEQMFRNGSREQPRVDLSQPGVLEREIGLFLASRIEMRDERQRACTSKVEQSGEDPANDEGVLVVLSFECTGDKIVYDVKNLLAIQGPRAWQVVTIIRGTDKQQVMVNSETPPVALSE
jgi:hypothetical protein